MHALKINVLNTKTLSASGRLCPLDQGRSDGGYISIYTPKSVYLKFFMWLFCLLDPGQIRYRTMYTHRNQIPGYASALDSHWGSTPRPPL